MRAVNEGYEKRSMDELAELALHAIIKQPGLRCGKIGEQLFENVATHRGTAPFSRIAGKVMKRLEREGRAVWRHEGHGGWYAKSR